MGIFKLLFYLAIIVAIAGVAFYFAPDNIKEKGLAYITESPLVPAEVKKAAENIYATPALKRKQLLAELENNLGAIQSFVETTSKNPEPVKKLVTRTKEIVEQVIQQNQDPTIIKQITDSVTEKLIGQNKSCSGN